MLRYGTLDIKITEKKAYLGNTLVYDKSSFVPVNAETTAFFTALAIPNNTDIYYSTLKNKDVWQIIDNYITAEKANGSFLQVDYPMIGGSASKHSINLVNPSLFQVTWFGGWVHNFLGSKGNGVDAYARTGFILSSEQNINSNGISYVSGTDLTETFSTTIPIGSFNNPSFFSALIVNKNATTPIRARLNNNNVSGTITSNSGIFTAVRQSEILTKIFKDSAVIGSGNSGGNVSNLELAFGTGLTGGSGLGGGVFNGYSVQRFQTVKPHIGLTDAQVIQHHININNREAALLRKTW